MRAEIISLAVDSKVACPQAQFSGSHEKKTDSGSEVEVPLSRAKNGALLRPRSSPLKSGSRRLARAAPRRILRCVHAGSPGRAQTSSAEPYETRRHDGDNPGSCFVAVTARTMAPAGGHRDPTPPRGGTGTSCGDFLANKFGPQCKKTHAPPTLMSRELPCAVARTNRASVIKITTPV